MNYNPCPYCNSIQATTDKCPACGRRLTPEDWDRKEARTETMNEKEGGAQWTRQGGKWNWMRLLKI